MKPLTLAAAAIGIMATASSAQDAGSYWVVGNRASNRCEIVTSNPIIDGDVWFSDGPYRSKADAKLARSTIGACPNKNQDDD
jgi:hypothetical protein